MFAVNVCPYGSIHKHTHGWFFYYQYALNYLRERYWRRHYRFMGPWQASTHCWLHTKFPLAFLSSASNDHPSEWISNWHWKLHLKVGAPTGLHSQYKHPYCYIILDLNDQISYDKLDIKPWHQSINRDLKFRIAYLAKPLVCSCLPETSALRHFPCSMQAVQNLYLCLTALGRCRRIQCLHSVANITS